MTGAAAFGMVETLLSPEALRPHFQQLFGDAAALREWFDEMTELALVETVTGAYVDFGSVGEAALNIVAERRNVQLTGSDRKEVERGLLSLPPYPDVVPCLQRLIKAGLRLAVLTNTTPHAAESQLEQAGLRKYFEQVLSADAVRRFKPARETYLYAADSLRVEPAELRVVSAHGWDVAGAVRAGCMAAFVARPGHVLDLLAPEPYIQGKDLKEVADRILAVAVETA